MMRTTKRNVILKVKFDYDNSRNLQHIHLVLYESLVGNSKKLFIVIEIKKKDKRNIILKVKFDYKNSRSLRHIHLLLYDTTKV